MISLPAGEVWFRRVVIVTSGCLVAMLALSLAQDFTIERLTTDWTAFDNAGTRVLNGEVVYRPWNAATEPYPYLYPPFALWLAIPLSFFGFHASWLLSAGFTLTAFVGGLMLLRRVAARGDDWTGRPVSITTGMIGALTTGTAVTSALIGQYSGVYVLAVGLGLWLFVTERPLFAGLALAMLLLKPNIAVAMLVVIVWARSWRLLAGFVLGAGVAVLASIPFGFDRWSGFVSNVRLLSELQTGDTFPVDKMIVFWTPFQRLTGLDLDSPVAIGAWAAFAAIIGVATLMVWTPKRLQESPQRAFALWAMFVIIANPRMFFYDGTLVVFGVLGLWTLPPGILDTRSRKALPPIAAALWVASWGSVFSPLNLLVAPLGAVLLVWIVVDMVRSSKASASPDSDLVGTSGPEDAYEPPIRAAA